MKLSSTKSLLNSGLTSFSDMLSGLLAAFFFWSFFCNCVGWFSFPGSCIHGYSHGLFPIFSMWLLRHLICFHVAQRWMFSLYDFLKETSDMAKKTKRPSLKTKQHSPGGWGCSPHTGGSISLLMADVMIMSIAKVHKVEGHARWLGTKPKFLKSKFCKSFGLSPSSDTVDLPFFLFLFWWRAFFVESLNADLPGTSSNFHCLSCLLLGLLLFLFFWCLHLINPLKWEGTTS